MLGQPVYFLTPDVVGVHLTGAAARRRDRDRPRAAPSRRCCARRRSSASSSSSTATGAAVAAGGRPRDDRQHGAGVRRDDGLLPGRRGDAARYLRATGRTRGADRHVPQLLPGAGHVRHPAARARSTTRKVLELDLVDRARRASPGRSVRRTASSSPCSKPTFANLLQAEPPNGYGKTADEIARKVKTHRRRRAATAAHVAGGGEQELATAPRREGHAQHQRADRVRDDEQPPDAGPRRRRGARGRLRRRTSPICTRRRADRRDHVAARTPRIPSVMLAAGLLAKKAVERGLNVPPVGEDLARAGLARRHRLPTARPACRRISTSSASTPSATAARPASATPARSTRASRTRSRKNDLVGGQRAHRQPQLRGARAPERSRRTS